MYDILIVGRRSGRSDGGNLCCPGRKNCRGSGAGNARRTDRLRAAGRKLSRDFVNFRGRACPEDDRAGKIARRRAPFCGGNGLSKTQNGFLVSCADGAQEARTVILATGASHRKLGLSQEDALTGCGISYCAVCDGAFYDGAGVAVVGGGDTALQDALFLANTCRSVTLIHRRDAFRASAQLVRRAQAQENIRILQSCTVQKLLLSDDSLQGAELFNGKTGETERIYVEGLLLRSVRRRRARLLKMPLQPKTDTIWQVRIQKQACRASLQPATDAKSRCASSRPPSQTGQRPRSRHAAISMPGKVNPDNSSHSTAKAADLRRQLFCSF